jgi:hypothetical protein
MPRCQRTFERLPEGATSPGTGVRRWVCACCDPPEAYETLRDPDLLHYAGLAENACAADFGRPADASRPTLLLLGLRPECVLEPVDRRYDIYLARGSDPLQMRLQIGHEVFHRCCSQGRVFHWTHEMLACLVSLRLLRRHGAADYAAREEARYREEARACPLAALLAADPWASAEYPPGYYGRACVVGLALSEAVGWDRLRRLARRLTPAGVPDVAGWRDSLPPDMRIAVDTCLSPDTPENTPFPNRTTSGTIPDTDFSGGPPSESAGGGTGGAARAAA